LAGTHTNDTKKAGKVWKSRQLSLLAVGWRWKSYSARNAFTIRQQDWFPLRIIKTSRTCCYCCDRKAWAACAQSFALWQQATIEFTCHDHSVVACSYYIHVGVVLLAHPVRGESRIQRNARGEVATVSTFCVSISRSFHLPVSLSRKACNTVVGKW